MSSPIPPDSTGLHPSFGSSPSLRSVLQNGKLPPKLSPLDALASQTRKMSVKRPSFEILPSGLLPVDASQADLTPASGQNHQHPTHQDLSALSLPRHSSASIPLDHQPHLDHLQHAHYQHHPPSKSASSSPFRSHSHSPPRPPDHHVSSAIDPQQPCLLSNPFNKVSAGQRNSDVSFITESSSEFHWRRHFADSDEMVGDPEGQSERQVKVSQEQSSEADGRQHSGHHRINRQGSPDFKRLLTGSVKSNQLGPQIVPRQHITSVYGDQEMMVPQVDPVAGSSSQALLSLHRQHSSASGFEEAEEVLGDARPRSTDFDPHRLTSLTNLTANTELESDCGEGSMRYASGHSISSEDPFQYWRYETPRQAKNIDRASSLARSALPSVPEPHHQSSGPVARSSSQVFADRPSTPSAPNRALTAPAVPPDSSSSLSPSSSNASSLTPAPLPPPVPRNFSRPLRPNSAAPNQLPTPPPSRERSPGKATPGYSARQGEWDPRSAEPSAFPPVYTETIGFRASLNRLSSSTEASLYSEALGEEDTPGETHPPSNPSSPVRRRSSVDTMSSTSTKKSWRNLFRKPKSRPATQTDQPPGSQAFNPALPSQHPPSIRFGSPDSGSRHPQENDPITSLGAAADESAHMIGRQRLSSSLAHPAASQTSSSRSRSPLPDASLSPHCPQGHGADSGRSTQSAHLTMGTDGVPYADCPSLDSALSQGSGTNPHRLSIYSLGGIDDMSRLPSDSSQKSRYMSRSPVSISDFSIASPASSGPTSSDTSPLSRAPFTQGAPSAKLNPNLPPSMAKAKASLAFNQSSKNPHSAPGSSRADSKAHEYLQMGIEAHERGDLERSAGLFERAARENGGCGPGMLMWGLSLRHGWGCQVNEARAFKWLQKAAELVVEDLDLDAHKQPRNKPTDDVVAAKSELVLAIYELGQCFMRGWGCKKDKQLAINYFELAAKLGDPDAQQELGFCYANGQGTKRDLKKAAQFYRMAAKQGVEMMGFQWIWKDKYN